MANKRIQDLTAAVTIDETTALCEIDNLTSSLKCTIQDLTGLYSGNYGGVAPVITPLRATAIAFDTSDGSMYKYYSGAWH